MLLDTWILDICIVIHKKKLYLNSTQKHSYTITQEKPTSSKNIRRIWIFSGVFFFFKVLHSSVSLPKLRRSRLVSVAFLLPGVLKSQSQSPCRHRKLKKKIKYGSEWRTGGPVEAFCCVYHTSSFYLPEVKWLKKSLAADMAATSKTLHLDQGL